MFIHKYLHVGGFRLFNSNFSSFASKKNEFESRKYFSSNKNFLEKNQKNPASKIFQKRKSSLFTMKKEISTNSQIFHIYMNSNEEYRRNNSYSKKLSDLILNLKEIEKKVSKQDKRNHIRGFMRQIGELYLTFFKHHLDIAKDAAVQYKKILHAAVQDLDEIYVGDLENLLTGNFQDNEWERACIERTNIEAFNEMFSEVISPLDTEDLEEEMRQVYEYMPRRQVSKEMPPSHWWWFTAL